MYDLYELGLLKSISHTANTGTAYSWLILSLSLSFGFCCLMVLGVVHAVLAHLGSVHHLVATILTVVGYRQNACDDIWLPAQALVGEITVDSVILMGLRHAVVN